MNISKTIHITAGGSQKTAPINNYYYNNDTKTDDGSSYFGIYINFLSFIIILFLITTTLIIILYILLSKKSEKVKVDDDKWRENRYEREHNNTPRHFDRGDCYTKNMINNNICSCRHNHLQPNIYQKNFENMIGYGNLVNTTFDECLCRNNCEDCVVKCRKPLNIPIPIMNLDENCNNDCKKTLVVDRLNFVPCLRSYKECFVTRK